MYKTLIRGSSMACLALVVSSLSPSMAQSGQPAETPKHVVFQSVLYMISSRAESDPEAGARLAGKAFGVASTDEVAAILSRVRDAIAAIEDADNKARKRILCGHGKALPKVSYYKKMDALGEARLINLQREFVIFMADLSESQQAAFSKFIESKKPSVAFVNRTYEESYRNSDYDVRDVVAQMCANFGEPM